MKKYIKIGAFVGVISMVLVACNGKPAEQDEHQHQHQHGQASSQKPASEMTTSTTVEQVSFKDDALNAIYQQYLLLSEALVKADANAVREVAIGLEIGAKEIENGSKLSALAMKIGGTADIEKQRILFSDLSNEMISRVKGNALNSGKVYVEHCAMAMNDEGAFWLSNQKEIRNPYYGNSMLNCGDVKETLTANH